MALDWNDLQFCLAVARDGTVSAAAKKLGVDHATIIRRIDRLERDLGAKLFARRKTGYELTEAGRRAAGMAETIESQIRGGQAEILGGAARLAGTVRVGAPDGFGSFFLAPRLGPLAEKHPELQIELVATARLFSLSKREADIAISLALPREGRIYGRKLLDYRLFLYASPDYLAKTGPIRTREDIKTRRLIGYISELLFTPELDYLPQILPGLSAQIRSANLIAQLQAVLAGLGIAVLPRFLAQGFDLVAILPDDICITRSFYLLMHADGRDFPQIRAVADHISAATQAEKSLFLDPPKRAP
ncbi:DNA-binding transcriptional LysR family regulator [Rhodoblastus acidophilus]|uniref:LysR family transcriptional regulator n=1 Tax=Rhodoblastus acidophilus TaxID=1074 RepID=UPI002225107B|nr:LysR family transcriptional regulator [Rhodoblastus acidophilus]MCW2286588.1 DNA-binding transcriptional LysR family regulator [Rhodoblastus acidophilus]MCW2335442.1 DNA-binding transcriptional LysR family regulator [Rhodoblastus acidophilus]